MSIAIDLIVCDYINWSPKAWQARAVKSRVAAHFKLKKISSLSSTTRLGLTARDVAGIEAHDRVIRRRARWSRVWKRRHSWWQGLADLLGDCVLTRLERAGSDKHLPSAMGVDALALTLNTCSRAWRRRRDGAARAELENEPASV